MRHQCTTVVNEKTQIMKFMQMSLSSIRILSEYWCQATCGSQTSSAVRSVRRSWLPLRWRITISEITPIPTCSWFQCEYIFRFFDIASAHPVDFFFWHFWLSLWKVEDTKTMIRAEVNWRTSGNHLDLRQYSVSDILRGDTSRAYRMFPTWTQGEMIVLNCHSLFVIIPTFLHNIACIHYSSFVTYKFS